MEFESFAPPQNDMTFRWVLMGMVGANLVISILFETLVADGLVRKCDKSSVKKHETINQALDTEFRDSWPPLTSEDAGNLSSGLAAASSESLGQGEDGAEEFDNGLIADEQNLHFGKGQTETVIELAPGRHTLQLVLGDANHVPHDPPVTSAVITITVE
ncbi:MAG: DUF4399 domain-containing protein [Candidatus Puniceispirillaceae bacterium]